MSPLFFKYTASSFLSWIIDISVFSLIVHFLRGCGSVYYITVATVLARVVSSVLNYLLNKKIVFKNKDSIFKTFGKYMLLFLSRLFLSAGIVTFVFVKTGLNESMIKTVTDLLLFIIGYILQREWVFKNR